MTKSEQKKIANTLIVQCITLSMELESKKVTRLQAKGAWDMLNGITVMLSSEVFQEVSQSEQYQSLEAELKE